MDVYTDANYGKSLLAVNIEKIDEIKKRHIPTVTLLKPLFRP